MVVRGWKKVSRPTSGKEEKKVNERVEWTSEGEINKMWEKVTEIVKTVGEDLMGRIKGDKETLWWNKEVQVVISTNEKFKEWQRNGGVEGLLEYQNAKKKVSLSTNK